MTENKLSLSRRTFMAACAAGCAATAGGAETDRRSKMGVVIHSYGIRGGWAKKQGQEFSRPAEFVEFCAARGAGGVQLGLGNPSPDECARLRDLVQRHEMYIESSMRLPQDESDSARFEAELKSAAAIGVDVVRVAILSGRRYETFDTLTAFREFAERAHRSISLAEPIARRARMPLAIENHKDWRIDELLAIMKRYSSEYIGICLDTGNSISLLEDPYAVVEAYAPYTLTTHIKDMGVEEFTDGFLLSEVPLGTGFLDLPRIIATVSRTKPRVRWNLEMITRDPLRIPCLTDKYWATLANVPGQELAAMLATVRRNRPKEPLPRVTGLSIDEQVRIEDENVRRSLAWSAAMETK